MMWIKNTSKSSRIILSIAGKDMLDALKNRTTVSILLATLFMVLSSMALPMLLGLQKTTHLEVWNPAGLPYVDDLKKTGNFKVFKVNTLDELQLQVSSSIDPALGLVLPADMTEQLGSGADLVLEAFIPNWLTAEKAGGMISMTESALAEIVGQPLRLNTDGNILYPTLNEMGRDFMLSVALVLAIMIFGVTLVPNLWIEERQAHTLDAILVSPASMDQVVIGKLLAGCSYCLVSSAVLLAFSTANVVHWWSTILAVLLGTILAVAIGLLMGTLFKSVQASALWVGLVIILLLVPLYLGPLFGNKMPAFFLTIVNWLPSVALSTTFRLSFTNPLQIGRIFANLGIVALWGLLMVWWVVARVRRLGK